MRYCVLQFFSEIKLDEIAFPVLCYTESMEDGQKCDNNARRTATCTYCICRTNWTRNTFAKTNWVSETEVAIDQAPTVLNRGKDCWIPQLTCSMRCNLRLECRSRMRIWAKFFWTIELLSWVSLLTLFRIELKWKTFIMFYNIQPIKTISEKHIRCTKILRTLNLAKWPLNDSQSIITCLT